MEDDLQVIQRVREGDVDAFRTLVKRYEGPLFRFVRNLVEHAEDSDDVAQETFLAAFAKLDSYDPDRAKFSTWLFTIARNKCLNLLKRKGPFSSDTIAESPDWRDPVHELTGDEFYRRLDAALDELPFEQKAAFVLAEFNGLPYEEIGRIESSWVRSSLASAVPRRNSGKPSKTWWSRTDVTGPALRIVEKGSNDGRCARRVCR